jgi:hypothetical protein
VHGAAAFAELLPRLEPATALQLAERQRLPALAAGALAAFLCGMLFARYLLWEIKRASEQQAPAERALQCSTAGRVDPLSAVR